MTIMEERSLARVNENHRGRTCSCG